MASVRWMGLALLMLVGGTVQAGDYPKAMKKVAKKFKGDQGKVVPMGDSLTYANQAGRWG